MPLPVGTYPIGGPIILTGEKPPASEELYAAGARWLGPHGTEIIERTGSPGSYAYAWRPTGSGAAGEVVPAGVVGAGLTPSNATSWHAYQTTELLNPDHVYEFIMQRGADPTVQAPTISFYGRELLEDIPANSEDAGDGYNPNSEPNHLVLIHGTTTTTGGQALHVARKARAPGATVDNLLIHFESATYRINSLVRLARPAGSRGTTQGATGFRCRCSSARGCGRSWSARRPTSISFRMAPAMWKPQRQRRALRYFPRAAPSENGLLTGTRRLQASDLAGYSWAQSLTLGAEVQAVVVRIEGTLGPLDYALRTGSVEKPDPLGGQGAVRWAVGITTSWAATRTRTSEYDKRATITHTRYHGELAGRAADQVQGLIDALRAGAVRVCRPAGVGTERRRPDVVGHYSRSHADAPVAGGGQDQVGCRRFHLRYA